MVGVVVALHVLAAVEVAEVVAEFKMQIKKKQLHMGIGIIALVALIYLLIPSGSASGSIEVPLSDITTTAKFFEYEGGGTQIRFFVVKASDGSIKTAFDACDICFSQKKGYRQEGDFMICNNCGNKYAITQLGTEKEGGGCWPGYLPSKIQGDKLIIKNADLEKGRQRFS